MIGRAVPVVVLAVLAGAFVTTSAATASRTADSWLREPARTLAALDCGCTPDAARVARYRRALDALAARCAESRGRLAYIAKTATDVLRRSGRIRTNLWLLNAVRRTLTSPAAHGAQPCRFVFALVVESTL